MRTKNLSHKLQKIVAQAKIKGSLKAKTKAWRTANNVGQSQQKRVHVLICACVLLLYIISTQFYVFLRVHEQ